MKVKIDKNERNLKHIYSQFVSKLIICLPGNHFYKWNKWTHITEINGHITKYVAFQISSLILSPHTKCVIYVSCLLEGMRMNLIPRYIQLKGKNKKDEAPEVCTEVHIL
jgi:hypothetical protein